MKLFKLLLLISLITIIQSSTTYAVTMEAVFSEQDESPIRDAEKFHKAHLIYRNLQYQAMYGDKSFDFTAQLQEQLKPFDFKITFVPMSLWELSFLELMVKDPDFQEKIDSSSVDTELSSFFTEDTLSKCFKKVFESTTTDGISEVKQLADNHIMQFYPRINDSTTYEESIKRMASTIIRMMEEKFGAQTRRYRTDNTALEYPNFIGQKGVLLGKFENITNPLLKIIHIERKAFENNKLLLLRGTQFLNRSFFAKKDAPNLQDSNYSFSKSTDKEFSLSYGRSFFSGLASLTDATASVMHYYSPDTASMLYGIEVSLPLSSEALELFWIPPVFGVAEQIRCGEIAHPRSKTSGSTQGRPQGIQGRICSNEDHILELLKSSYTHPEFTKKYHAFVGENMVLYIPPYSRTGDEENITLDSLRQSNLDFSNLDTPYIKTLL